MLAPLKPADTVAIISTARKVTRPELEAAVQVLSGWGLNVVFGPNLFQEENQFAGSDAQRLADLNWALSNPQLKAVFFARGGYGTTRILDQADFFAFARNPKWLVGFSDITAVHGLVNNLGIESLHAPMPFQYGKDGVEQTLESVRKVLFGEEIIYQAPPHAFNRIGTASGKVIGGNLSMLVHMLGTRSEPQTDGAILFLEDLDEYLYHIDRMLVQLKRAGKLQHLAGLVIGHMSDMKDNAVPFGMSAYEIIRHQTAEFSYPVCFGFPVGHELQNMALICGRKAELKVSEEGAELRY